MKRNYLVILVMMIAFNAFGEEKIGLALSGGGARGFAHIGVLKVIDELEIPVDYIAGTSIGAVIGGLYAMGYSGAEIEEIFLDIKWDDIFDESISRDDIYIGQKRWKPYSNFNFALDDRFIPVIPQAFISGNNLVNTLFDITYPVSHIRDFNELQIPFRCVATNILNGEFKVFSEGSLIEVLRASMSFPSVIEPFELDGQLYIDGGIRANLPAEIVKEMGADFIIGINTCSGLKEKEELISLIDVLDQTINLNITENVEKSVQLCDALIEPDLEKYSILNFKKKKELIAIGEQAGRQYFRENDRSFLKINKEKIVDVLPEKIKFSKIVIIGNKHLSKTKIREYLGLQTNTSYSKNEIEDAITKTYHSELFKVIYPVIRKKESSYHLIVKVKERNRKHLGFSLSYNNDNELAAGAILDLNNIIQKNSKLLVNIQLGARNEFNLDYAKNFGKHWGIYFRTFPYVKEYRLFSYDSDHEKTNSVRSSEYGGTFGIGLFTRNAIITEAYGYTFRSNLYRDVAEFEDTQYTSTGVGIKLYHESLDDYVFPMKGTEILMKFSTAKKGFYCDKGNRKFYTRLRMLLPFGKNFSIKYKFEYGSYFENSNIIFDPFYIGGIDSFLGLYSHEMSAPIFKTNSVAFRINFLNNFYSDLQINILNLGNVDYWLPEKYLYKGIGTIFGYNSLFGPLRFGVSINDDRRINYYLSIGYEFDPFEFSRR
ncbi:MAG: patatin-like phospholipase family protein [Candidatus Cloacimonetes bacterium]|nr:patatin-like phospholipase family protein [Candidatus Cloacimonadota bacterium]